MVLVNGQPQGLLLNAKHGLPQGRWEARSQELRGINRKETAMRQTEQPVQTVALHLQTTTR